MLQNNFGTSKLKKPALWLWHILKSEEVKLFLLPASSRSGQNVFKANDGIVPLRIYTGSESPMPLWTGVQAWSPLICGPQPLPCCQVNLQRVELQIPLRQGHWLEFPEAASRSLPLPCSAILQPQGKTLRALLTSQTAQIPTALGLAHPNCRRTAGPLKTRTPQKTPINADRPQSPRGSVLESCLSFHVGRNHVYIILLFRKMKNDKVIFIKHFL